MALNYYGNGSAAEEEAEEEAANALSARLQARILCERSAVKLESSDRRPSVLKMKACEILSCPRCCDIG